MSGRLDGKVAVVTGGSSGIGAATVRRFVDEGGRVVIADLDVGAGKQLSDSLGDAVRFIDTDVAEEDDVVAAIDLAVSELGGLDIMFNNAGVLGAVGSIADTTVDAWDRTVAVLVRSVFLGMKHAARVMVPQRSGVILSTASIAGVTGGFGPHAYTASKHAVIGITKSVASELASKGVRVNAIAPGATVTAMTSVAYTGEATNLSATADLITASSRLGIAGAPNDIANAAVYLASDEARYVTGHCLVVDAGLTTTSGSDHFFKDAALVVQGGRRA